MIGQGTIFSAIGAIIDAVITGIASIILAIIGGITLVRHTFLITEIK
jgi:hypothetical protein